MDSPPSSRAVDAPAAVEAAGSESQRPFLRLSLGHAHWFAKWFGAEGEQAERWLNDGLSNYPLALGAAMPQRRPQLFWRAMLGTELPGDGRMRAEDDRHLIDDVLARLDPAARAAFLLRVWHDFDDELLADLLGLRVGQVRVGLMRAFGRMRASLDDGSDVVTSAGQWLLIFRARLASLAADLDAAARAANERRIDRLFGIAGEPQGTDVEGAPSETGERTDDAAPTVQRGPSDDAAAAMATAASLRDTTLADAGVLVEEPSDLATRIPAPPTPMRPARRRHWYLRLPTVLRWALPLSAALFLFSLANWLGRERLPGPAAPVTPAITAPAAVQAPGPAASATMAILTPEVEAVLASPDLPLLSGTLNPNQLAVMDQLRWWASTRPLTVAAKPQADSAAQQAELPVDAPLAFEQLSAADRRLLQGFAGLWPRLGEQPRLTLLDNARRWRAMDAAARERVIQRSQSFVELPAQARARARDSHVLWLSLPPDEQSALVSAFAAFAALTPEQQRAVADGFARLSPSEQARWRFADGERELLGLAGRVFSFVPEAERAETLALLQSLDEADRDRLRQGTRRMSAWQREQLRKSLLAEPEASRSDWLRRRFGG